MFDHHAASVCVRVPDFVDFLLAAAARLRHHAMKDAHACDVFARDSTLSVDVDALIDRIRKQSLLAWLYHLHHAFTGEGTVFENVERACIQRIPTGVLYPDGA